ncbi:bifunctional DNA-formamidopyrimidine glycosylase/DNA-(apurinic or apyrimidinic site) lyase [Kribbella solani]|uniref:bifunctional DNA-formamidopyrimidine glycosylase/DNA-(apurinic or apyrimidinic site) lyase n=1 Tax=Kribbella solani TaxID=236067 RepID=UPI0029ADEB20|nr:bifunctional DNA-formamidopyrimidine glycosylase/DNA-(apurinic or apyrimidinic site) lyase [Kribbella solani]MDX2967990.1 bifunctional DNA-formamidopyrimidine glycosylase/DNA-(apurinic or apyrimidinic site) lyase [Kribbella solani]MDX3002283.1 bifunctional DNA-formamidopyrimidine glycosylase/DNA-(apurinic or apyrimidinic site) lyase [Kribbella solani]
MPELPEVEVVRRGLAEFTTGRTIDTVEVLHPRPVRRHLAGPEDFASRLKGQVLAEPARRGKYLWLPLTSGDAVLAHLGMSGQFRVQPAGAPDEPHLRVRFRFADGGGEVRFVDQRMFGGLSYAEGGAELPAEIAHIARDPFDPLFDPDSAVAKLRRRRTGLKRALLDQTVVSGIGNIYADEALWRARLHYARATETMKPFQAKEILAQAYAVMSEALIVGGTSFDALYVNVNGESGYFERGLNVYGQEGSPCPRDGRPIRREPFMNRSSYRCPRCQPVPRHVRW